MASGDAKFASGDTRNEYGSGAYLRSSLLAAFAEAARSVELEPYRMLRKAGLPEAALDQGDLKIPAYRVAALLDASAQQSGHEDFGLRVGQAFRLSMKGPLGLLLREQPTVGKAVEALAHYMRYQNTTVELAVTPPRGGQTIEVNFLSPDFKKSIQAVDMSVAMYVQILRGLLGAVWMPTSVRLTRAAPADETAWRQLLGDVAFGQDANSFELSAADVSLPIAGSDAEMAREIARYIEMSAAPAGRNMTERVRELIVRLLPDGDCGIDRLATHLGVDRRTIHRRLAGEGRSFTQLVEDTRRDMVTTELRDDDVSLGVVAAHLGFSSLSTFSRWFRHTYGIRASEFRQLARQ